jgi:hypothetical protein
MPNVPIARLPATEAFPRAIHVGSPSWFTPQPIALAYGESGVPWSLHLLPDGLTLMGRHADGVLRTTRHLSVPAADVYGPDATIDAFPPRLLALRDTVYVSTGNHLLTLVRDEPVRDTEFPSAIIGLVGTWPLIRPRNAVTHERGGFVVWGGLDRGHMQSFSDDLPEPVAGFTREGTLVAVTPSLGTIYDTHDRVVVARTRFAAPLERPIAILPTHQRNEFALCLPNGEIGVFRIPD